MTDERESYRRIISSTSISGGATIVTILIGLIRNKLFALTIGPAGIGLIGMLTNIIGTGATVAGMGLGFSGVRQIAAGDEQQAAAARRALWVASWILALAGGALVWLLREPISLVTFGDETQATAVGLSGIGVALTVIGAAQVAVLQGSRRIADLARVRILGAVLATMVAIPAVLLWGAWGIVVAVLAVPLGNALAALPFRPASPARAPRARGELAAQWRAMLALGGVLMLAALLASVAIIAVRTIIVRGWGIEAGGYYQAAYSISAMNVALVLSAMSADYFPRLATVGDDKAAASRLVDQQLRTALLLGAPLLVGLLALAPWALRILYSDAFGEAADILRWQLAGDLLKMPGWALGYMLIARKDSLAYILVEASFVVLYPGITWLLAPTMGPEAAGIAYLAAYAGYSGLLYAVVRHRHGVRLSGVNLGLIAGILLLLAGVIALASWFPLAAMAAGVTAAAALVLAAIRYLGRQSSFGADRFSLLRPTSWTGRG